ncbi:MAG: hypothetical protein HQ503_15360 [Rhodospirillales bacterium]|nr:hypothetical protein [Rhodospirillales bacterium]
MLIALAVLLAGCATADPVMDLADITFKHLPKINLRIVDIQIDDKSKQTTEAPHVGHQFPVPPVRALKRWAEDRLQAQGSKGTARFTLLEAQAIESKLEIDKGIKGFFTKEQSERYTVTVSASLEIFDDKGIRRAIVRSKAMREKTVLEDVSLTDRRKAWFEMTEALMAEFNTEMQRNIQRYMTEFVL